MNSTEKTQGKTGQRSRKRSPLRAPSTGIVNKSQADEENLTWQQRLKRWIVGFAATGFGISLIVHILLLAGFSFYIIRSDQGEEFVLSSNIAPGDESLDFEEIVDVRLDVPQASDSPDQLNLLTSQPTDMIAVPAFLKNQGDGKIGEQIGFRIPTGGNAVSKGSFTAWTVPQDPEPHQDYLIIIQIKLPQKIKKYRKEDLSGFLTGDDGYTTPIAEYRGNKFPKKFYGKFDMEAKQFIIKIPGAAAKVKDEIKIESRILREKQRLIIVF